MNDSIEHERVQFTSGLVPIESNVIRAARYDPTRRVLEIVFRNKRLYHFVNVPPEVYENLMSSGSKGRYFLRSIRNVYPYWRFHGALRRNKP